MRWPRHEVKRGTRSSRSVLGFCVALALTTACGPAGAEPTPAILLATTTSLQDSGLLDDLIPRFEEASGRDVKAVAVGSGQAIELASRGEADVVLAHSPAEEESLLASGAAQTREMVMYNDFVIVGPDADPAQVRRTDRSEEAMSAIAAGTSPFVSRGDDSGTHVRELDLWASAGVDPAGDWYRESGQGMGATLQIASELGGYAVTDRGTYLSAPTANPLEIVFEGGAELLNPYHVLPITAAAGDAVDEEGGRAFADWILGEQAQECIGRFAVEEYGQQLFVPAAGASVEELPLQATDEDGS